MNHPTRVFGDSASVASRFGSANGITQFEKLINVLCFNNTGGVLYLQVHEVNNGMIPNGTSYSGGGSYTLAGLTIGHTYNYDFGANEVSITNGVQVITSAAGTFVATATTATIAGTNSALVTLWIKDLTTPNSSQVPAEGAVPRFSFPVQGGLGGELGQCEDMTGIYCCWSSTQATKTIAAASGSITIIVKA